VESLAQIARLGGARKQQRGRIGNGERRGVDRHNELGTCWLGTAPSAPSTFSKSRPLLAFIAGHTIEAASRCIPPSHFTF
jgi:hypothetical protein